MRHFGFKLVLSPPSTSSISVACPVFCRVSAQPLSLNHGGFKAPPDHISMLVTLEWSTQMMFLKSECRVIGLLLPLLRQMQENTQKHVTVCELFVSTTTNRNMCKNRYEKLCSTGSHTYGKVQHKHDSD